MTPKTGEIIKLHAHLNDPTKPTQCYDQATALKIIAIRATKNDALAKNFMNKEKKEEEKVGKTKGDLRF